MASGTRLREAGQRKTKQSSQRGVFQSTMGLGLGNDLTEQRLNQDQINAIENMYQTNPAVQAAKTVLSGQLLSGGISLVKNGEDVELTPQFRDHLNEVWIPFAGDVLDCFLKWGFVPISYEEHDDARASPMLADKRQRKEGKAKPTEDKKSALVPVVPSLGTYEVAFKSTGRVGYQRKYVMYPSAAGMSNQVDEDARVVVRQHPDASGNVNSPLATVFELGSFVSALNELAITAEISRCRPRITTQMRKRDTNALDPGTLFFDSASRDLQNSTENDESANAARALELQRQLCAVINSIQTRKPNHDPKSHGPHASSSQLQDIAPSLFTIPKDQEMVQNPHSAESRGDLESLQRLAMEQFASALGVPSDLIFTGRYAGKSTSQLSLLNITTSQLAKSINLVLTTSYRDIYASGMDDDVGQLQLLTSPLAATEEVMKLYQSGLVPLDIALPTVMNALGCTKQDIDRSLEKALAKEELQKNETRKKSIQEDETMRIEEAIAD